MEALLRLDMDDKLTIAIIPARGGSKRLPGKNIKPFFGHPLIAYTISAALRSNLFHKVIVSTDSPEIGEIGQWYGAEYLPRPKELATDKASLIDVALHTIESLEQQNFRLNSLCQLMPNCPLRRSEDIVEQFSIFENQQRLFQISTIPYRGVYPHWALAQDSKGRGRWVFGSGNLVPSQDLETVYCPTGAIWWVRVNAFRKQRAFYGDPFHLCLMDANRGLDIDRMDELELGELLVQGLWERDKVFPLEPVEKLSFLEEK